MLDNTNRNSDFSNYAEGLTHAEDDSSVENSDKAFDCSGLSDMSAEELTVQEKQLRMGQFVHQYIKGQISEQTFEKELDSPAWKNLEVDYAKAALEQTSVLSIVCNAIKKSVLSLKP